MIPSPITLCHPGLRSPKINRYYSTDIKETFTTALAGIEDLIKGQIKSAETKNLSVKVSEHVSTDDNYEWITGLNIERASFSWEGWGPVRTSTTI